MPKRSSGPAASVLTFGSLGQAKEQYHRIIPITLDPKSTNPVAIKPFRINVIVLSSTLAICEKGIGETGLTGQIGVELLHVYLGNRDM